VSKLPRHFPINFPLPPGEGQGEGIVRRTNSMTPLTATLSRRERGLKSNLTVRVLVGFLAVLLFSPVYAEQVKEDPLERQVLDISKDLRCAVCQNQPISESDADLARDMRNIIREQIKAGKSRAEILQYFVDRYGDYVLMRPPVEGPGALLWIMPMMIALILAAAAFFYLQHRRGRTLPPAPALSKKDHERVQRARERLDS
jgi:cytochrome c-type biogenesis protein CcmH